MATILNQKQAAATMPAEIERALESRDVEALQKAIEAKANIHSRDEERRTPLMIAVQLGFLDGVKALLDAQAPVNARDAEGRTALMMAAEKSSRAAAREQLDLGARAAAQALLAAGAVAGLESHAEETALSLAVAHAAGRENEEDGKGALLDTALLAMLDDALEGEAAREAAREPIAAIAPASRVVVGRRYGRSCSRRRAGAMA